MLPTGILICCAGPFWSGSLCLFGFFLPSLLCLISTLTQVGRGDLLFRFASSVLLWGGRGTADRYRCVWGAHTVFRPHWVCPVQGCLCFPRLDCSGSQLLYMEHALPCVRFQPSGTPQRADSAAPVFCAFPGPSSSGNQELDGCTLRGCGALSPLRCPSLSFCACGSHAFTFVFSRDPPRECWPSRISGSLYIETGGLFAVWEGIPSLGPSLPLSPPPCLLPPAGMGWSAAG